MPSLQRVASLKFPSLAVKNIPLFCLSSRFADNSVFVSRFDISVPHVSPDTARHDQVISFRLGGGICRDDNEILHGVILVSRLLDIVQKISGDKVQGLAVDRQKEFANVELSTTNRRKVVRIVWADWSSMVSLREYPSTTAPESEDTRILELARSRIDHTRAVLVVRDYNQRMLLAPRGHMTRNLGPAAHQIHGTTNTVADTFRLVTGLKSIKSMLFGGFVDYGLNHRIRYIDLGVFQPNTMSSKTFWGEKWLIIDPRVSRTITAQYVTDSAQDSSGVRVYAIAHTPTLLCRCGRAHLPAHFADPLCTNRGI